MSFRTSSGKESTMAICLFFALALFFVAFATQNAQATPFHLHPENPHYFLFRGEPTLLITSAEHYGAVLNADFDYARYLETLAGDDLNNTRIFVGAYCEKPGDFGIARNTLAPASGRFICPWARSDQRAHSDQPGYANGGNKFDLETWDSAYFERLKDLVARAGARGIVVEVNLFCPFYKEDMWDLSPMQAANNVNGIGAVDRDQVYTLDASDGLLEVQVQLVRKVAAELKGFDNIYYEIMNEPYARSVPMAWQEHIVDALVEAERTLGVRHLISLNIANDKALVKDLHPQVSLLNFHYAWPPETVPMNYHLDRAIGDNETGFRGIGDFHYRREGWAFILAGGALYNNLDYSFAVGYEDGTFAYPDEHPGGGNAALRAQLRVLGTFIRSFDFVHMAPFDSIADLPENLAVYALAAPGQQYAVYLCHTGQEAGAETSATLTLDLPPGTYRVEWIDTLSGERIDGESITHDGGACALTSPPFTEDLALRLLSD
jgi:hypothetical protein